MRLAAMLRCGPGSRQADAVTGTAPRYNRLLAEAGFAVPVRAIKEAFDRSAGIALPIISPRGRGPEGKRMAVEAIRACAP
jgi:hypothetical protein